MNKTTIFGNLKATRSALLDHPLWTWLGVGAAGLAALVALNGYTAETAKPLPRTLIDWEAQKRAASLERHVAQASTARGMPNLPPNLTKERIEKLERHAVRRPGVQRVDVMREGRGTRIRVWATRPFTDYSVEPAQGGVRITIPGPFTP